MACERLNSFPAPVGAGNLSGWGGPLLFSFTPLKFPDQFRSNHHCAPSAEKEADAHP